jgi:siroheme synthase
VDWVRLARGVDTIVVLMGVSALPRIAKMLSAHGRAPSTPAAVVRWGATERQTTLVDRLDHLAVSAANVEPPAVIVIGEVVALRERIAWCERRGHRIARSPRTGRPAAVGTVLAGGPGRA